jgi:hypothetical protein
MAPSGPFRAGTPHGTILTQQVGPARRLKRTMKRYRDLAFSLGRPMVLALIALLLILVVLPAALALQAAAIR